jgi:predicted RNase H-like nuclease (RuvC/YqgF family)
VLGASLLSLLVGGQFLYIYSLSRRSQTIQDKKQRLKDKKQALADKERDQYERKIAELEIQVEKYRHKYSTLKAKYEQSRRGSSSGMVGNGAAEQSRVLERQFSTI